MYFAGRTENVTNSAREESRDVTMKCLSVMLQEVVGRQDRRWGQIHHVTELAREGG
jgi:hypothetical protein